NCASNTDDDCGFRLADSDAYRPEGYKYLTGVAQTRENCRRDSQANEWLAVFADGLPDGLTAPIVLHRDARSRGEAGLDELFGWVFNEQQDDDNGHIKE